MKTLRVFLPAFLLTLPLQACTDWLKKNKGDSSQNSSAPSPPPAVSTPTGEEIQPKDKSQKNEAAVAPAFQAAKGNLLFFTWDPMKNYSGIRPVKIIMSLKSRWVFEYPQIAADKQRKLRVSFLYAPTYVIDGVVHQQTFQTEKELSVVEDANGYLKFELSVESAHKKAEVLILRARSEQKLRLYETPKHINWFAELSNLSEERTQSLGLLEFRLMNTLTEQSVQDGAPAPLPADTFYDCFENSRDLSTTSPEAMDKLLGCVVKANQFTDIGRGIRRAEDLGVYQNRPEWSEVFQEMLSTYFVDQNVLFSTMGECIVSAQSFSHSLSTLRVLNKCADKHPSIEVYENGMKILRKRIQEKELLGFEEKLRRFVRANVDVMSKAQCHKMALLPITSEKKEQIKEICQASNRW